MEEAESEAEAEAEAIPSFFNQKLIRNLTENYLEPL